MRPDDFQGQAAQAQREARRRVKVEADTPKPTASAPPSSPRRIVVWLMLLACLAAACPPLLLGLGRPDAVMPEEARALASSIETWRGDSRTGLQRFVPYLNLERQLAHPPAVVWSHLAAFSLLGVSPDAPTELLILDARLTSVAFSLLLLGAIFWAGHSIGGPTAAVLAALVCAANPVFLFYGRLASGATQQAAFTLLAIAAALWAIRPLRPAPSVERQFIGWVVSGLACGAAIYTAGPWSILHILVPVVLVLILVPGRMSHSMGLLAALLIGTLMVCPWCVYAYSLDPAAAAYWLDLFMPRDWTDMTQLGRQAGHRAGYTLAVMLPWTIWLLAAVMQPFSTSSAGTRLRLLLGWLWFLAAVLLVILSPWSERISDQILALPAAAVLVGQLFSQYAELASEGRYARLWRWLRWPQLALLLVMSVVLPVALMAQPELVVEGWLPRVIAAAPPWYAVAAAIAVLLAIWGISAQLAMRHYPARAVAVWALWTLLLSTALAWPLATGPVARSDIPAEAQAVRARVGHAGLFWVATDDQPEPDPALLLYLGRPIPPVQSDQLPDIAAELRDLYLLTPRRMTPAPPGSEPVRELAAPLDAMLWRLGDR